MEEKRQLSWKRSQPWPDQSKHLKTATILGLELDFVQLRSEEYSNQDSRIPSSVNSCSMTGDGGGPSVMQCGVHAGNGFFGLGSLIDLNLFQQNSCSMGQPTSPFYNMGGGLFP
ncbi:CCA tRNA nucleotidyltransferase, mitochondrial [Puccinia graminis f. sp. tritici]|uniref:CCA tRNA nucleotidyltransferase, mitochondrial n=1 Tax=Puccinia graminis f. sp. tritici TaxID=56615 RepID=A0A5B0PC38_PUCGR|nr:CCA tRNA nucleotidyltransferase, mitochondrial [Puccinia graminis f. sp. tritici]